jgi:predicted RND superfamily exporter protein
MSTVLETLSITELNKRKIDLLKQLKRVNDELDKRELVEKIETSIVSKVTEIIKISDHETVPEEEPKIAPRTCKIKIKIKRILTNNS